MNPAVYIAGWVASGIASAVSVFLQAYNAAKDFPWRKLFAWSLVAGVVYYFFGLLWYGFKAAMLAVRFVGGASNFSAAGSPTTGLLGTHLNLSVFWSVLSNRLPEFWRYLMWWLGIDWFIFVGVNILHMSIIARVVDSLLTVLARSIREVFRAL